MLVPMISSMGCPRIVLWQRVRRACKPQLAGDASIMPPLCGGYQKASARPVMRTPPPPQAPGTYHLRTTILPPEEDMQAVGEAMARFHSGFLERYGRSSRGSGADG